MWKAKFIGGTHQTLDEYSLDQETCGKSHDVHRFGEFTAASKSTRSPLIASQSDRQDALEVLSVGFIAIDNIDY